MERTIEDIIRDAEVAYKAWCERLETLEYDETWNEDEINIIQEAFKAEYEKKRAQVKDNSAAEILKNMQTLVDILRNPVENRSIEDFEREEKE